MKYTITKKTVKKWQDKEFTEAILVDETGTEFKVSAWKGEYDGKDEIECELEKNDKGYWIFKKSKLEKPNFIKAKEAQMEKAMATKSASIAAAQDRSSWLWAKNNASTLIANNENYKNLAKEELLELVNDMATNIYNQEPSVPFN